jgi:hypothetical protein
MPTYRPIQYSVEEIDWIIVWRRMSVMPPLAYPWLGRSGSRLRNRRAPISAKIEMMSIIGLLRYVLERLIAASLAVLYSTAHEHTVPRGTSATDFHARRVKKL